VKIKARFFELLSIESMSDGPNVFGRRSATAAHNFRTGAPTCGDAFCKLNRGHIEYGFIVNQPGLARIRLSQKGQ
jgi:hypothetical protein